MPTPEYLVAFLQRLITTAEHQDELPQITNITLIKDIEFQMGQMVLALINARNTLREYETAEDDPGSGAARVAADMIDLSLKGEL